MHSLKRAMVRSRTKFREKEPNEHTRLNPRKFDVDITSIRQRPNFEEIPHHVRILFQWNFVVRKTDVASRYFFDVISLVKKPTLFPRTFFNVISIVKKFELFPCTMGHNEPATTTAFQMDDSMSHQEAATCTGERNLTSNSHQADQRTVQ